MRLLIDEGVNTFVEVGPGRVLVGLLRQIERRRKCPERGRREKASPPPWTKIAQAKADAA